MSEVEMRKYAAFMFFRLLDRCFFITAEGDIGLGPGQVQKGDLVCIFLAAACAQLLGKRGTIKSTLALLMLMARWMEPIFAVFKMGAKIVTRL
jgi:hypothetical protein